MFGIFEPTIECVSECSCGMSCSPDDDCSPDKCAPDDCSPSGGGDPCYPDRDDCNPKTNVPCEPDKDSCWPD